MINTNYDFAYIFEKIIEPIFRKINVVRFLALIAELPQQTHNLWQQTFFPRERQKVQWNSTKLAFEFLLNQEFNPNDPVNRIYITNTPNTDFEVFLFKTNETPTVPQVFLVNDNVTNAVYPVYAPFNSYSLNQIVRYGNQLFFARVNSPAPNSITNRNFWLPVPYVYKNEDILSLIDFVVYVPSSLFTTDFDLKLRNFINRIKLFNRNYEIQYY